MTFALILSLYCAKIKFKIMKIEKNIPIPESRNVASATIDKMDVGDSVFFEKIEKGRSFSSNAHRKLAKTNYRMLARKEGEGLRIWKIKRK